MNYKLHWAHFIALLIAFSAVALLFLYFNGGKAVCKLNASIQLSEAADLTTIKVPNHLVNEHQKEIEFEGKLYDIESVKQCGDSTILVVWADNNEQEINAKIISFYTAPTCIQSPDKTTSYSSFHHDIPDGKIMPTRMAVCFSVFSNGIVVHNACHCYAVYQHPPHTVIKPPPDQLV